MDVLSYNQPKHRKSVPKFDLSNQTNKMPFELKNTQTHDIYAKIKRKMWLEFA